jgi:hypothetical protein
MTQKQNTYSHYWQILKAAEKLKQEILETPISFYFRIFENKQCKELHIHYKKI